MRIWLDGAQDLWRDENGGLWATKTFDRSHRPKTIVRLSDHAVRKIRLNGDPMKGVHEVAEAAP